MFTRRRTYRKKRTVRKRPFNRSYRPRVYPKRTKIHSFVTTTLGPQINGTATGATTFQGNYFTFSTVPNSAQYTALFDQYMITKIQVKFIMNYVNSPTTPGAVCQPNIYIVTDHDDASPPTTIGSVLERENSRILSFAGSKNVYTHTFCPAVQLAQLGPSLAASGAKFNQWCDSSYANVQHMGIKYCVDGLLTNATITPYYKIWFKCKETL